jgi:hypothetical protein
MEAVMRQVRAAEVCGGGGVALTSPYSASVTPAQQVADEPSTPWAPAPLAQCAAAIAFSPSPRWQYVRHGRQGTPVTWWPWSHVTS